MAKWIYESEAMEKTYCPVPNFNNENSEFGTSKCMGGKCGAWVWLKDSNYRDRHGFAESDTADSIFTHEYGCGFVDGNSEIVQVKSWFFWTKTEIKWISGTHCDCHFNFDCYPEEHPDIKLDEQGMCGLKLGGTKS